MRADLITVAHNATNHALAEELFAAVRHHEPDGGYRLVRVDNRETNRGFARACNLGAFHPAATAPIIGFLNPDLIVDGPFLDAVTEALVGRTVITGCRFDKSSLDLHHWGVTDWVCGAALFVTRRWFRSVRGFDTQYVWSHDETDLIRQAETQGSECRSIDLPLRHQSPTNDSREDREYKRFHFAQAQQRYFKKWGRS